MSGLCSVHQGHDSECNACNAIPVKYHLVPEAGKWCLTHNAPSGHPYEEDTIFCMETPLFIHENDWNKAKEENEA